MDERKNLGAIVLLDHVKAKDLLSKQKKELHHDVEESCISKDDSSAIDDACDSDDTDDKSSELEEISEDIVPLSRLDVRASSAEDRAISELILDEEGHSKQEPSTPSVRQRPLTDPVATVQTTVTGFLLNDKSSESNETSLEKIQDDINKILLR